MRTRSPPPRNPLGDSDRVVMSARRSRAYDRARSRTEGDDLKATERFVCPSCELHELEPHGRDSALCPRCGRLASVVLKALRGISALPDAMGAHACECGHPEMRRLPDGVYRCPACGLEVLPV